MVCVVIRSLSSKSACNGSQTRLIRRIQEYDEFVVFSIRIFLVHLRPVTSRCTYRVFGQKPEVPAYSTERVVAAVEQQLRF